MWVALGGMHGCSQGGACMVALGGRVWWGVGVAKGGHGWQRGGMYGQSGVCVAKGGMVKGGVCMVCTPHDKASHLRGQYASYWNAFLFITK